MKILSSKSDKEKERDKVFLFHLASFFNRVIIFMKGINNQHKNKE